MKSVYHSGERAVQERAGVRDLAERIGRSIHGGIPPVAHDFIGAQPMAVLAAVGAAQERVGASLLTGAPGFMKVLDERRLRIEARPVPGDPLGEKLDRIDDAGLLIIDLATRRRMRVNGNLRVERDGAVLLRTKQVYSNCPKYIQAREWRMESSEDRFWGQDVQRRSSISAAQQQWIARADTFFIASYHKEGGADASHRGGNPGFVRVSSPNRLTWADYPGNNMFQTLGNLSSHPPVGLLFVDFESGRTLQLTGRARVIWDGTERTVESEIDEAVEISNATRLRWRFRSYSPFNPS